AYWPGTVGWPANVANAAPTGDNLRSNNVLGDGTAGTAAHSLSEDNADTDYDYNVVESQHTDENDTGPREPITPAGQVSERSLSFRSEALSRPSSASFYPTTRGQSRDQVMTAWPAPERAFGPISERC